MINKFLASPLGALVLYLVLAGPSDFWFAHTGVSGAARSFGLCAWVALVVALRLAARDELRRNALPRPAGFTIVISEADLGLLSATFRDDTTSRSVGEGLRKALAAVSIEVRG